MWCLFFKMESKLINTKSFSYEMIKKKLKIQNLKKFQGLKFKKLMPSEISAISSLVKKALANFKGCTTIQKLPKLFFI